MIIFNELVGDHYAGVLTLTKTHHKDISLENLINVFEYVMRGFLWHPDFVYMTILGQSRLARLKVDVREDIPPYKREVERYFAFPMWLKVGEALCITNGEETYPLNVGSGMYYVIVEAREFTFEEMEDEPRVVRRSQATDIPIEHLDHLCSMRISLCKNDRFRTPLLLLRDPEIARFDYKLYVLNSNYEPVLLDGSDYEFF